MLAQEAELAKLVKAAQEDGRPLSLDVLRSRCSDDGDVHTDVAVAEAVAIFDEMLTAAKRDTLWRAEAGVGASGGEGGGHPRGWVSRREDACVRAWAQPESESPMQSV